MYLINYILMKEENNSPHRLSVNRFILLSVLKRIKRIMVQDIFICHGRLSDFMGYHETGNQRYITLAYRYIQEYGCATTHVISDFIATHFEGVRVPSNRIASQLFAKHPMFLAVPHYETIKGTRNSYQMRIWDIVPEYEVVDTLHQKVSTGVSLGFKYSKYPLFIREQVEARIATQSNSPTKPNKAITQTNDKQE